MSQTILITGSSTGIGRTTAEYFQAKGWNVIATMRTPEKAGELAKLDNVLVTRLDVTDSASIQQAVEAGIERFGRIDVLLNNAGYGAYGPLEAFPMENIRRQFDTNVIGLLETTKAVLPHMRERQSGCILNVSSIAGRIAAIAQSPYVASKWAVEGLTEGLAQEVALHGIRVALIEPGIVKTAIMAKNTDAPNASGAYDAAYRRLFAFYASGLMTPGEPSEVSEVIYEAATTDDPKLRYTCGWGGVELVEGRSAMSDEDWVELGAIDDDAAYVERFKDLFGLDIGAGI